METSRFTTSFNGLEVDDVSLMDYYLQMDSSSSVEEIFGSSLFFADNNNNTLGQQSNGEENPGLEIINEEKPIKKLLTNNWINESLLLGSKEEEKAASNSAIMLSFDNPLNYHPNKVANNKKALPQQSKEEHILAEKKRRQALNQRFLALSTLIPGLKKMDKATVLGDAYKYVKQLEKQVKTIEELTNTKTIESAMLVNQSRVSKDDVHHSSMENASTRSFIDGQYYPEIEARFSNKEVLIRIHCQKKNMVVENLISEIENLHLVVVNTSTMVFGFASIDATFVAQLHTSAKLDQSGPALGRSEVLRSMAPVWEGPQNSLLILILTKILQINVYGSVMGDGFTMTAKDLVRHLNTSLKSFI